MDRSAIIKLVTNILRNPLYMGIGIAGLSALSLAMALTSQYAFGLLPCILCIYQRIPFVIAIFLGIFIAAFRKKLKLSAFTIFLSSIAFFVNSGIAFYHSGVERLWWEGTDSCAAPDMSGSAAELIARIKSMAQSKCTDIPWADPIFGGSMANYNVLFCLGLGVVCLLSSILIARKANGY